MYYIIILLLLFVERIGVPITYGSEGEGVHTATIAGQLNDQTTPDRYAIPHVQDFGANLAGKTAVFKDRFCSRIPSNPSP